jgi:hypothetical protein
VENQIKVKERAAEQGQSDEQIDTKIEEDINMA